MEKFESSFLKTAYLKKQAFLIVDNAFDSMVDSAYGTVLMVR